MKDVFDIEKHVLKNVDNMSWVLSSDNTYLRCYIDTNTSIDYRLCKLSIDKWSSSNIYSRNHVKTLCTQLTFNILLIFKLIMIKKKLKKLKKAEKKENKKQEIINSLPTQFIRENNINDILNDD